MLLPLGAVIARLPPGAASAGHLTRAELLSPQRILDGTVPDAISRPGYRAATPRRTIAVRAFLVKQSVHESAPAELGCPSAGRSYRRGLWPSPAQHCTDPNHHNDADEFEVLASDNRIVLR